MSLQMYVLIGKELLSLGSDVSFLKKLNLRKNIIESLDNIYEISITKNLLIITTEDEDFRNGNQHAPLTKESRTKNNINAYDWDGNHLWNIADIVGDIKMPFYGGNVTTKENLQGHFGVNMSNLNDSHDFYVCTSGSRMFIIDLNDRTVSQVLATR